MGGGGWWCCGRWRCCASGQLRPPGERARISLTSTRRPIEWSSGSSVRSMSSGCSRAAAAPSSAQSRGVMVPLTWRKHIEPCVRSKICPYNVIAVSVVESSSTEFELLAQVLYLRQIFFLQTTDICCYRCRRCFSYNSNSFRNTLAAPWTIKRWGRQSSQEASGARGASWQRGQRCSERAPVACASTPAARAPNVAVCRAQCRPDRVVGGGGATMAEQWTGVARGIHTCS